MTWGVCPFYFLKQKENAMKSKTFAIIGFVMLAIAVIFFWLPSCTQCGDSRGQLKLHALYIKSI